MLTEVIRLIREKYPTMDIVGLIEKDNIKSIGLFEKLGFQQECFAESIYSYVYVLYLYQIDYLPCLDSNQIAQYILL